MPFNYAAAKQAGYSDTEIADYLSQGAFFNAAAARKAGYDDEAIIKHLQGKEAERAARDSSAPAQNAAPAKPTPTKARELVRSSFGGPAPVIEDGAAAAAVKNLKPENPLDVARRQNGDVSTGTMKAATAGDLTNGESIDIAHPGATYDPGESWSETGSKIAAHVMPGLKASLGGAIQGLAENQSDVIIGPDGTAQRIVLPDNLPEGPTPGEQMQRDAAAELDRTAFRPGDNKAKYYAGMLADSMIQMVPSIAATIATRNPEVGMATMFGQVGGQQYGDSRNEGRTPGQATADALYMGATEILGEKIPLERILAPGGGKLLKETLTTAGLEGAQEMFTQVLQTGYDAGVLKHDMTLGEAMQQVIDAGIVGAGMGVGMHVAAHPFNPKHDVGDDGRLTSRPVDDMRVAPAGVREGAVAAAAVPTQGDMASPLDTADIVAGKTVIAKAGASKAADTALAQHGLPSVGSRVVVDMGDGVQHVGAMEDWFEGDDGKGVVVKLDNGKTIREFTDTLADAGVTIRAESPLAEADALDADLAARAQAPLQPATGVTSSPAPAPATSVAPATGRTPRAGAAASSSIDSYLAKTKHVESGGDANAKNPRSSASGSYQFTDGTWLRTYRAEVNDGKSDAEILALKGDAATQERLMRRLTKDNADSLARHGHDVTDGNLYLSHFAGSGGANALLNADPNASAESILGAKAIAANPFLKGKTAGEVIAWAAAKMGGPAPAAGASSAAAIPSAKPEEMKLSPVEFGETKPIDTPKREPAEDMAGKAIDEEWTAFRPDTGTLGIPRAEMPQIKAEHRGAMVNFLNARGIAHEEVTVPASSLKPTQAEFSRDKVSKTQEHEGGDRAILISQDGHVVDGHHQWLAALNDNADVRALKLDAPIRDVLAAAHEFPSSTTAEGSTEAQAPTSVQKVHETPAAPADVAPSQVSYETTPSGKGFAVIGATPEDIGAIAADVPKAKASIRKDGAHVYSTKYDFEIRQAVLKRRTAIESEARKPLRRPLTGKMPTNLDEAYETLREMKSAPQIDAYDSSRNHASHVLGIVKDRGQAAASKLAASTLSTDQRLNAHEQRAFEIVRDATPGTTPPDSSRPVEEHPGLVVKSLQTGKETTIQPAGTVAPAKPAETKAEQIADLQAMKDRGASNGEITVAAERMPDVLQVDLMRILGMDVDKALADIGNPITPSKNRLVTDERAAELRDRLKAKLNPNRLNSGIDPEILAIGTELAVYHIEKGARRFAALARAVAADLDAPIASLRSYLRGWYNGARDMMEDHGESVAGMDDSEEVAKAMRTFDQWANETPVTATPADDTRNRDAELPNSLPTGDARPGASDVPGTAEDRGNERASGREGRGSPEAVQRTDGERSPVAERSDSRSASGSRGDRAGVRDADNLPSKRGADSRVTGTDWAIAPGSLAEERSPAQKARDNVDAIALVKQIEREGRPATREEQAKIAQYVGWGGLKNAFPDSQGEYGKGFEKIGPELRALLTDAEYETARRSIQYAHYTSETVVRSMWDIAERLGFRGGAVFEPGMGTGNFRGMMPSGIAAASHYQGLEYDHLTASIAKLLYPQSGVQQADYTRTPQMVGVADLVIGNPPFSETTVASDPAYAAQKFVLHDFFFAKSLDAVKPGGLLMFVTSAGTMNKFGDKARAYLADRADLVGAIRLPGNAFDNAGTSVTTDIVILRKRAEGEAAGDRSWVDTVAVPLQDRDGNTIDGNVNRYFVEHPEMILGEQGMFDKLVAGPRYAVRAPAGFDLGAALKAAADRLPASILHTAPKLEALNSTEVDFGSSEKKDGSYYVDPDGRLMQFRGGVGRPVQSPGKGVTGGMSAAAQERVRGLVPVRDALRDVYHADVRDNVPAGDKAREALNKAYDAFVKKFGPINKTEISYRAPTSIQLESARAEAREEARLAGTEWEEGSFDIQPYLDRGASITEIARDRKAAREAAIAADRRWEEGSFDPDSVPETVIEKRPNLDPFIEDEESYRLAAVEHYNKDTGQAVKGKAFFENAVRLDRKPVINSAQDALLYSLNRLGRPDIGVIADMAGKSQSEILEELHEQLFEVPGQPGAYETAEVYLSGNVRDKLAIAQAEAKRNPAIARNVKALEAALPAPLTPSEIAANLGMPWIPTTDIEQFVTQHLGLASAKVKYLPKLAQWTAAGDTYSAAARSTWGTQRMHAMDLLEAALNRQTPQVYDRTEDGKRVLNAVATQAAQDKMAEIKAAFRDWIWKDDARAHRLTTLYNEQYNSLVAPKFDGSYLTTPGIASGWEWRPHQRAVIARIIQSGNTYMAHEVGAGKTSAMIGAGMEMKRLGLVSKPMYVVPNHMLGQFTKEFYEQYPLAKIRVADETRFHTSRRKEFVARMAADDLDAVIITHSAFGYIPMSDDYVAGMIDDQIAEFEDVLSEIGKDQDQRVTRRKIEQQKESLEQRLKGLSNRKRDQVFTFEETGVDFLFVDEAHLFRKLDFSTKMGNVKGVDPNGSQMSFDLYSKTRHLEDVHPGRNLVLASGTPITNTMAELYSVSRYLQQAELDKRQLAHFDAWAGAFGDTKTELEQDPAGGYKPVTRFAKFVNVPELSVMVRQVMDVVGAAELRQYVTLPTLKGGARQMVLAQQTDSQAAYGEDLKARMEKIRARKGPPSKGDDILLSVINDGRKAAIDYRLIDPMAPKERGSKLEMLLDNVHERHQEFARTPFHAPGKPEDGYSAKPVNHGPATQMVFANLGINGAFPVHKYIKQQLVQRGVPATQIAIISDYKTHVAKQRLFNDMNEGKVRLLIGSVAKMGTGVNAQKRLRAIHNMDALWFPADDTQRNGRGIRQGNMNPEIEILDYSTKGTYDSQMWNLMAKKASFIEGFMRGDPTMRDMEDLGEASQYEQAAAMTTSDPRIMELTEWKQELEKLERRKVGHEREKQSIRSRIAYAEQNIDEAKRLIPLIEQDIAKRVIPVGDEFTATAGGQTFTDRAEFGAALLEAMDALTEKAAGKNLREGLGELGGFAIVGETHPGIDGPVASYIIKRAGGRETSIRDAEDSRGLVTRLVNALKKFDGELSYEKNSQERAEREIADYTPRLSAKFEGGPQIEDLRGKVKAMETTLDTETKAREAAAKAMPAPAEKPKDSIVADEDVKDRAPAAGDIAALRTDLHARLDALGLTGKVTLNVVDALTGKAEGRYWPGRRVIEVLLGAKDAGFVLDHESIHALRDMAVFTATDWKILTTAAKNTTGLWQSVNQRYAQLDLAAREEEAVADLFGRYQRGDFAPKGMVERLFIRLVKLLSAARNALRGQGFTTPRTFFEVLDEVASGKAATREGQGEGGRAFVPAFGRKGFADSIPDQTETDAFKRWFGKSIVIDGDEKPMPVHHWTYDDFEVFDRNAILKRRPERDPEGIDRVGHWFTGNTEIRYANPEWGGKRMDVYLKIEKPLWLDDTPGGLVAFEQLDDMVKEAGGASALREELKAKGHDGIILQGTSLDGRVQDVYITFEPSQIKSATDNDGGFDPDSDNIKFSIPERDDMVALGGTDGTWGAKMSDAFDGWRTAMQDRYLPLLRVQREIEAQTGQSLPPSQNPYMGEELMTGRIGARLEALADKQVGPLWDAMHEAGVSVDELESYLYARHAPERNARMSELNPAFQQGEGSGMTDIEARAVMNRIEREGKTDAMKRLAARVDAISRQALDYRVETGLMSEQQAKEWRDTYQHYIPLRGFKETGGDPIPERINRSGGGINVRGRESKAAYGRRSKADSPLAYIILQAEEAIVRGETNLVAQKFVALAKANPDDTFWKVNKTSAKQRINEDSGLVETYLTHNLTAEDEPWTVSAKVDGKQVRVTLNKGNIAARRLADSMKNLTQHQLDWVTLHLGKVNRFLSAVNTSWNPEFVVTNAFRDIQTAAFNLAGEDVDKMIRGVLKDYLPALKAATKGAFGKGDGEWGAVYDDFVNSGGRVSFNQVENVEEIKKRIKSAFEMAGAKRGEGGAVLQAKRGLLALKDFVDNMNGGVENAVRLATFKNAREAGLTSAQAASMAKNITVNFNRRGTMGPAMNAAYLFFNASVQGTTRIFKALRSPKVRKMMGGVMIASALVEMLNSFVSDDDDDGESFYDKIPAYEKGRNMIFMLPGGREYIKVPMPYGYNVFWDAGRSAAEIARRGGDRWMETSANFISDTFDAFNPVGGGQSLLNFISPTIADPVVDLVTNTDFTGRKIMPDQPAYAPPEPDNQRYWGSVGKHWRMVADFLNEATGGDDVQPGAIDVSPETLEYMSGTVFGAAGGFLDRLAGLGGKLWTGEDVTASDIPFGRKVVGGKPSWYDKGAYYDRIAAIDLQVQYAKNYLAEGKLDEARAFVGSHEQIVSLEPAARAAKAEMKIIRKARKANDAAFDRGRIDKDAHAARKAVVDEAEKRLVTQFNTRWNEVMTPAE